MTNFRLLVVLSIALSSWSCSIFDSDNIAPGYKAAYKGISSYFFPEENELISPEIVDNIPYASALIRVGKGKKNLIILESINKNTFNFVSSDSVYFSIKEGRVISTSGLTNNLREFIEPFSIKRMSAYVEEVVKYVTYYSYDNPELIRLEINANFVFVGKEEVDLFTQRKLLSKFEEIIENEYLGWKRKNIFWLDENGFVWKSVQNISPKLPQFEIIVTKKPVT